MCDVTSSRSNRGTEHFGEFADVRSYVGNTNNELPSFEHVWLYLYSKCQSRCDTPCTSVKHGQSPTAMSKTQSADGYRTALLSWLYCSSLFTVTHPSDVIYSQLQQNHHSRRCRRWPQWSDEQLPQRRSHKQLSVPPVAIPVTQVNVKVKNIWLYTHNYPCGGVKSQLHWFFNTDSIWGCIISFTPQPIKPRGKSHCTYWT